MKAGLAGILLAAGQGSRFGSDKLLHPLADGTPMGVAAARNLLAALPRTLAVVADAHGELARLLEAEGIRVIGNPRAPEGMGTSIACGVAASADADGWVIALGDMPRVPPSVIRRVVAALAQGADLVAPVCHGRRGHPVGFAARHGPALQRLEGDRGARGLLAAHAASLQLLETDAAGVVFDIDTPGSVR